MLTKKELNNFLSKLRLIEESQCWEWQGALSSLGYGHVNLRRLGGRKRAHRVSFAYFNEKPLDNPLHICHKCDNPKCCNPDHLFESDQKGNIADMLSKGRGGHKSYQGESATNTKLTSAQVSEIKARLTAETNVNIAKDYNVTHSCISAIRRGVSWAEYL